MMGEWKVIKGSHYFIEGGQTTATIAQRADDTFDATIYGYVDTGGRITSETVVSRGHLTLADAIKAVVDERQFAREVRPVLKSLGEEPQR